ncbi:MAG TPA: helix-turn-helix domain-containing protein, partial [Bacillota bacterium]|nr:helix-turn-helix domain-containing protein [Bacillota bacterium]
TGNTIELQHIPPTVRGITASATISRGSIRNQLKNHEKAAIEEALKQGGSVSQAARILGIPRQTLQYRMKIHGIRAPRLRTGK